MDIEEIREKLHRYIDAAEDRKVEALFILLENDINNSYDHWEDEKFVAEMERRIREIESGEVKGILWEEVKAKARVQLNTTK